ncbi:MAG: S8 family serine peptidase [Spirochaetales bacterium]|nr:S8 family serine peptidase [Spirochaetales bacterium]
MKNVFLIMAALLAALAFSCNLNGPVVGQTLADEGIVESTVSMPETLSAEGRYIVAFKDEPTASTRSMVSAKGVSIKREFKIVNAYAVQVQDRAALEALASDPSVAYIEEDYVRYALSETVPWGVTAVNAPQAWATTTGEGVKVAVLDTGIDYNHPDLAANYRGGYDFVNKDSDPFDGNGHGTHCAGTIAALTNNDIGVASVAYDVELYAVKVLSDEGSGYSSDILAGVDWAVDNGMHIASMSLGGGSYSTTENTAYTNAFNAGLLIVCATGNDGATTISYPAGYSATMGIGAVDSNLVIADFSNTGTGVDVVAPGVDVLSTVPQGMGTAASVTYGAQVLAASALEFSPRATLTKAAVYCGDGTSSTMFPASVAGNIALIQRGTISFADKVTAAMNAGAAGVIIYNNVSGPFSGTLGAEGNWIPSVSMSMEDGELLKAAGSPTVTLAITGADYDVYSGTSMATPHAAAVAALVKGANPALTNQQIWDILKASATDLGAAGYDTIYGSGIVNAAAAVDMAQNPVEPPDEPVQVTDTFTGTLSQYQYTDYQIAVAEGTISATLTWTYRRASMTLALYNPSGVKVATGTKSLSYNTNGVAGTYTLRVTNSSRRAYTTGYTLKVTYMK